MGTTSAPAVTCSSRIVRRADAERRSRPAACHSPTRAHAVPQSRLCGPGSSWQGQADHRRWPGWLQVPVSCTECVSGVRSSLKTVTPVSAFIADMKRTSPRCSQDSGIASCIDMERPRVRAAARGLSFHLVRRSSRCRFAIYGWVAAVEAVRLPERSHRRRWRRGRRRLWRNVAR